MLYKLIFQVVSGSADGYIASTVQYEELFNDARCVGNLVTPSIVIISVSQTGRQYFHSSCVNLKVNRIGQRAHFLKDIGPSGQ